MDKRASATWLAAILVLLVWRAAALAQAAGPCPAGYTSMFNVNEAGCTFCAVANPETCKVACLAPPAVLCPPGPGLAECCAKTPCAVNCPGAGALECNVSTCICDPTECCFTTCPTRPVAAPVLGSPRSALFGLVAVALAAAGVVMISRRRRQRHS